MEAYEMYVLLKDYGIKPWERNMDYDKKGLPIMYEQDVHTIMGFRRLEVERDKKQADAPNKAKWKKGIKGRASEIDFSKVPE